MEFYHAGFLVLFCLWSTDKLLSLTVKDLSLSKSSSFWIPNLCYSCPHTATFSQMLKAFFNISVPVLSSINPWHVAVAADASEVLTLIWILLHLSYWSFLQLFSLLYTLYSFGYLSLIHLYSSVCVCRIMQALMMDGMCNNYSNILYVRKRPEINVNAYSTPG